MKFSTKTRYGIRAMLEIATANKNDGVLQKDIAEQQGLSNKYLDHIIASLKKAELIRNVKGKKSGYILNKPASEITMHDIHVAFEKEICVIDCMQIKADCERKSGCKPQNFWHNLNDLVTDYFKGTTLQDIIDEKVEEQK